MHLIKLRFPGVLRGENSLRKLLQKTLVVFEEESQVVDTVAQHRQALDTHAERITQVFLAVDADMAEHLGVDHPAAQDLEPAGMAAHPAAVTAAHHALDIDF